MTAEGYSLEERGERTRVNVGGRMRRPCGTWAAFQRHRNLGEDPCQACIEAASRWKKYEAARKQYKRQRRLGASIPELGRLNERRLALELEYRSLEAPTDTPQPPSHRWKVYRLAFENGQQYVGITSRLVGIRVAEHVSGGKRLTGGSKEMSQLVAAGVDYEYETLASGLTESEAEELEYEEIAQLSAPLNIHKRHDA